MARLLNEKEGELFDAMQFTINRFRGYNETRVRFLEGEETVNSLSISIPPRLKANQTPVGWPKKSVEKLSERIRLEGFSFRQNGSAEIEGLLTEHFLSPSGQVQFRMSVDAALTHGPSFAFTSRGDTTVGEPEFITTIRSAKTATAMFDPRTGRVVAALEVLEDGNYNMWLPGRVLHIGNSVNPLSPWGVLDTFTTGTNRVLCSVYRHDPTTSRPFGQSRISRPLMGYTMAAVRTMLRQESAEDVAAAPRMVLLGATEEIFQDEEGNPLDKWKATADAIWGVPDTTDPDDPLAEPRRPELKSFPQMTQQPFNDRLRMLAEFASGETAIPPSELGLSNDSNPASAEAVQAHEGAMIRVAEKQKTFLAEGLMSHSLDILALAYPKDDLGKLSYGLRPRFAESRTISPMEQSQYVAQQVSAGNFLPGTIETLRELPLSEEDAYLHIQSRQRLERQETLAQKLNGGVDPDIEDAQRESVTIDNFGKAVRAGISFDSAKEYYGLDWAEDSGFLPTTLRSEKEIIAAGEEAEGQLDDPASEESGGSWGDSE